tara:strand:+ start:86 stop:325 length:240 start_codon:yes stop_codon:yes gene_type:complete
MLKNFLIKILEGVVFLIIAVNVLGGMIIGANLGGFGGFVVGTILGVVFSAFFGGIILIMLQNNELLKEIRNNTRKSKTK